MLYSFLLGVQSPHGMDELLPDSHTPGPVRISVHVGLRCLWALVSNSLLGQLCSNTEQGQVHLGLTLSLHVLRCPPVCTECVTVCTPMYMWHIMITSCVKWFTPKEQNGSPEKQHPGCCCLYQAGLQYVQRQSLVLTLGICQGHALWCSEMNFGSHFVSGLPESLVHFHP